MLRQRSRGDTIIEVMVAFGIFSLVAVGTVTVMNRGVASAERSLEVTLVREQIDAQAELLRYARSVGGPAWTAVKANKVSGASAVVFSTCPTDASDLPAKSFILTTDTTPATELKYFDLTSGSIYQEASVHSQFTLGVDPPVSSGFWAFAVKADTNSGATTATEVYDIYINACWYAPGNERPQWLRTIVRLHEA